MTYPAEAILDELRALLDADNDAAPLAGSGDPAAMSLEALLPRCLDRAVREAEMAAPVQALDLESFGRAVAFPNDAGTGGFLRLPPDFLRLGAFRLSGWRAPATQVPEGSPRHLMQASDCAAARGSASRPVCAVTSGQGFPTLEFWPWGGAIAQATYLPMRPPCAHTATFSERLRHDVTARAAAMALAILNGQPPQQQQ